MASPAAEPQTAVSVSATGSGSFVHAAMKPAMKAFDRSKIAGAVRTDYFFVFVAA
jgi:hypothetical protein